MKAFKKISFLFFSLVLACDGPKETDGSYLQEIQLWKKQRLEALRGESGFVNLAGLFWMEEGEHTFGASEENDLSFPQGKAPDFLGTILKKGDSIFIEPGEQTLIKVGEQTLQGQALAYHDSLENIPEFSHGSLKWTVIKRGDQYGVRLRDLEHPQLSEMKAIEFFSLDPDFRLVAQFEPYNSPRYVKTMNVLGMIYDAKVPGIIRFELKDKKYALEPNLDGDKLHLRFTDETTGESTYGLGRYLHIDMPNQSNEVIVDFNRAYNPPCAFTEFATCPIPPKENHLALKLEVGEKDYH